MYVDSEGIIQLDKDVVGKSQAIREILGRLKAATPCADCKQHFPAEQMDFDHVRGKKRFNIAQVGFKARRPEELREELRKCQIVCSNCHRSRTKKRSAAYKRLRRAIGLK